MAKDPEPPAPAGKAKKDEEGTPGWEKKVYAPERIEQFVRGEISLQDLHVISPMEMLEMAVLGYQFYEQGRYDRAKVIFQGLCSLDEKEAYYRTALGAVYLAQDNLELAEQVLTHALQLNPKDLASFVNRGEVFLRQGRIAEAADDFKKAVDLDPEGKDPLSHRAKLLAAAVVETIHAAQRQSESGRKPAVPGMKPASASTAPPAPTGTPKKK